MINWIGEHSLLLIVILSFIIEYVWILHFNKELRINWLGAIPFELVPGLLCVVYVMLFARFENWMIPGTGEGNMSIYGAVFLVPPTLILMGLITRRDPKMVCDIFCFHFTFGLMLTRINCLYTGCCLGSVIPGTEYRWPTREIEIVFDIVLMIILTRKATKKKFDGTLIPIYMISYGVFRFIIEWFRVTQRYVGPFHLAHIWSVVAIVIGVIALVILKRKLITRRLSGTLLPQNED